MAPRDLDSQNEDEIAAAPPREEVRWLVEALSNRTPSGAEMTTTPSAQMVFKIG